MEFLSYFYNDRLFLVLSPVITGIFIGITTGSNKKNGTTIGATCGGLAALLFNSLFPIIGFDFILPDTYLFPEKINIFIPENINILMYCLIIVFISVTIKFFNSKTDESLPDNTIKRLTFVGFISIPVWIVSIFFIKLVCYCMTVIFLILFSLFSCLYMLFSFVINILI